MKRYRIIVIAAVIAAIAAVITGCTGGGGESSAPGESSAAGQKLAYLTDELPHYDTVTALRSAATEIYTGWIFGRARRRRYTSKPVNPKRTG